MSIPASAKLGELSWIWLFFNGQHPDRQSLNLYWPNTSPQQGYMAESVISRVDRASQWTRDPLEQLPSGRLAVIAKQALDTSFIGAVNTLTGTTAFKAMRARQKRCHWHPSNVMRERYNCAAFAA